MLYIDAELKSTYRFRSGSANNSQVAIHHFHREGMLLMPLLQTNARTIQNHSCPCLNTRFVSCLLCRVFDLRDFYR